MGDTEKDSQDCSNKFVKDRRIYIIIACWVICIFCAASQRSVAPNIEIASMDFTVRNMTQTRLSANWDLLIRVPGNLPDDFICLQGEIQASLFYKNVTLATSSRQRYNDLKSRSPQQLRVSASISEEDIGGLIGKNILKDIMEKKEVKFGSHLFLTDCREKTKGVLRYVCGESTLRFEPGSETKATAFGDNPTCTSF